MRTDDYFQPCATIIRAIDEAKVALESKGYELVPFEHPQGRLILLHIYTPHDIYILKFFSRWLWYE